MRRIRYATGTVDPRDEGVAVPETGLGSLIPRLAEQAYETTNNTTLNNKMYSGLYAENPTEAELASGFLDISQAAGTPIYRIPEFDRYSYAARNYGALPSMYELYLGGEFDAAQDGLPISINPLPEIDTGAGGGGNIVDQLGTVNQGGTGINTPFEQNLIDQGAGVQIAPGQPVVAPGEMPVTQAEMDAYNQIPVNTDYKSPYDTGDANIAEQIAAEDRIAKARADEQALTNLEQARTGQYTPTETYIDGERTLADAGAGIDNVYATDYSGEPYDDLMNMVEPTSQKNILANKQLTLENRGLDDVTFDELDSHYNQNLETTPEYSVTRPAGIDASMTAPQTTFPDQVDFDQGFIDAKDYSAPGTLADPAEKMDFVTGQDTSESLYQKAKNYLGEKVADSIDWTSVIAKGLLNSYIGKPVSLLFNALSAAGIEGGPTLQTQKAQSIGLAGEGEIQDKYGINTESLMGDYDQYNIDRVEQLEDIVADQLSRGLTNTIQMRELEDRKEYNKISGVGGDVEGDQEGMTIAEEIALQNRIDAGIDAADEEPGTGIESVIEDNETGDASLAERIAAENRAAEAQRIENERAANAREEARANAAREAAARAEAEARAAARERARQPAPTPPQSGPHYDRPSGDNQNTGGGSVSTGAGRNPWGR